MNKTRRARIIRTLRDAKDPIMSGECRGICRAIRRHIKTVKDELYLIGWIKDMLGNALYLEEWVKEQGQVVPDMDGMIRIRLAWINWMIAEMERKN